MMKLIKKLFSKIRSENKPLRFFISRLLWKTGLCRFFLIKNQDYKLRFYPTALSCGLWVDPNLRKEDNEFISDYVKAEDIVIDIGANIGSLTILAALKTGPKGKVFSFEPHPKIYRYLINNIHLNQLTTVSSYNLALGNCTQSTLLSDDRLDDMNSIVNQVTKRAVKIKMSSLDELIAINKPIALIKIDVEGFEKFILEGAKQLLQQTECLYFEASEHHFKRYGYSSQDLLNLIFKYGFKIYSIPKSRLLTHIPQKWNAENGGNLVAIRHENDFICRTGYTLQHC